MNDGLHPLRRWLGNTLVAAKLRLDLLRHAGRVRSMTRDPLRYQRRLLARILSQNASTTFGTEHRFSRIRDYDDFVRNVPVSEYEALRPYIDAELDAGDAALTAEAPAMYARTSGTTGRPKDVPMTPTHMRALRRIQEASVAFQYRTCPRAFGGRILAVVSPAIEGRARNGKPYGSASGLVAGNTPALLRDKFVLPAAVLTIGDSRVKYLLILRLAIAAPDLTYAGAANPTTFLALMRLYRDHHAALIEDLRRGDFFLAREVSTDVLDAVRARLAPAPARADALARLHRDQNHVRMADLWPELRLVVTWTCAAAGIAAAALRRELGPRTRVLELGYLASEFHGTITLGRRAGSGLPTLDAHFFEFVERERWNRGEREFLTLDQLRKGGDYYVIVTTPSGLYRYFINDLVRVTGRLHRAPLLRFVQKGKGVTNITGEKLYEAQLLEAVGGALQAAGRSARFVVALADEDACVYRLYVEPDAGARPAAHALAAAVDAHLQHLNVEYCAKRESGRLGMLEARWLSPGAEDAYKAHCVALGQREGQFKIVALNYMRNFAFDFDAHVEAEEE